MCINGEKVDGHNFIDRAEKLGARVIVAEKKVSTNLPVVYVEDTRRAQANLARRFYKKPDEKLKLIGVTGTNGKTTVTHLIKAILESAGKKVGIIGTNKCYVGDVPIKTEEKYPTTPDSIELIEIFDKMQKMGAEYVVMEVSSHALSLERVYGLSFEVGVFTNLTKDHLDFHKSMEDYFNQKAKLFSKSKVAIINTDTSSGLKMLDVCKNSAIKIGLHDADILASAIRLGEDFVEFIAEEGDEACKIRLNIPGKFSVYNALSAIGACRAVGISYEDIKKGLNSAKGVLGRVEAINVGKPYRIFIDYAHTPDGLTNILQTARGFTKGRVIVLFGCGGDRDRTKRAIMGEIAGKMADFSIITSDNPRSENPVAIVEEIKKGIDKTDGEYIIIVNREEAIGYALSIAKEKDTILLCGKGQETYQIVGNKKYHFDEREIVKRILTE